MVLICNIAKSRPLREGVGRNQSTLTSFPSRKGRPLREGVGRNADLLLECGFSLGRPLREGVGRNKEKYPHAMMETESPSTRGRG